MKNFSCSRPAFRAILNPMNGATFQKLKSSSRPQLSLALPGSVETAGLIFSWQRLPTTERNPEGAGAYGLASRRIKSARTLDGDLGRPGPVCEGRLGPGLPSTLDFPHAR